MILSLGLRQMVAFVYLLRGIKSLNSRANKADEMPGIIFILLRHERIYYPDFVEIGEDLGRPARNTDSIQQSGVWFSVF